MGNCLSNTPAHLIEQTDGDGRDFQDRFEEQTVLGEGEFGTVKLVQEVRKQNVQSTVSPSGSSYACKVTPKGAVFKHNTLYAPIKPDQLRDEILILRKLGGKHFCLRLEAIYETQQNLLMVTEYCKRGEMFKYVSNRKEDLQTEDVSRIAYQLLDAVNHCAVNGVVSEDDKALIATSFPLTKIVCA